ncbi:MAG: hypothetical protein ACQES8_03750 [Thermodesulfobacteriota bacterium]
MIDERRIHLDRRSGEDRRRVYDLDYFNNGGIERRHHHQRRKASSERRKGWIRVEGWWASVYVGTVSKSCTPDSVPYFLMPDTENRIELPSV